jgi:hypothetical protein
MTNQRLVQIYLKNHYILLMYVFLSEKIFSKKYESLLTFKIWTSSHNLKIDLKQLINHRNHLFILKNA